MQLSHLKNITNSLTELNFQSENGELIPKHFHITEIGIISKKFIDCGGIVREEKVIAPRGDTIIDKNDSVVLLSTYEAIKQVEKLFSVRVDFF